ncbi:PAS domain-containing protein [bacterium]|nr:PAS domain-containing protein [bacterium]
MNEQATSPQHPMEFWDDYQHLRKEVTFLRNQEDRLKEVQARHKALFSAGGELYAVMDKEGTFVEINAAGLQLLELESGDVIGKNAKDIFGESRAAAIAEKAAEVIESGKPLRFDWIVRKVGGPHRHFSTRVAPVVNESGETNNAFIIALDISELEALREDLASLQDAVEDLSERVGRMVSAARTEPKS